MYRSSGHQPDAIPRRRPPAAFTLIELMVVVAIIAILIGLLMPAIQKVRESAARASCSNNMKQIGLAMMTYESTNKSLPSGSVINPNSGLGLNNSNMMGWGIAILPYIEQNALYDQYRKDLLNNDPLNAPVLGTSLKTMNCPSDPFAGQVLKDFQGYTQAATSSYKGVAGKDAWNSYYDYASYVNAGLVPKANRGALPTTGYAAFGGTLMPTRLEDIADGTSNTMLVGEYVNKDSDNMQFRSYWAMSYVFFALGSANPDPTSFARGSDSYNECAGAMAFQYCRRAFGSAHKRGMYFVYTDGHVRWIHQFVDGTIYANMATIAGGENGIDF